MGTLEIRTAKKGDEAIITALLHELAEYEKLLDRFRVTPEIVGRDFFGDRPLIFCDLAFEGERPAGIATWFWTYSSFAAARRIFLADLFVRPEFRGRHYGKALLANLAKRVLAHGGVGVDWDVLDWNKPSIDFYEGIGATPNSGWITYGIAGDALTRLARS
jgi:GNAT superfamily N-acetyltransferase